MEATRVLKETIQKAQKYKVICHEGGSRCFGKNTKVRMFNGKLKNIQDIVKGDLVMGSDGVTAREVLETHKGFDDLYLVRQNRGVDYVTTGEHLLVLKQTRGFERKVAINGFKSSEKRKHIRLPIPKDNKIEIRVDEYLNKSKRFQRSYSGIKQNKLEFKGGRLPIDPYYLGLWLGDGTSARYYEIATGDVEILDYLKKIARKYGSEIKQIGNCTYNIECIRNGKFISKWKEVGNSFRELGLINNKHIPDSYLYGKYKDRLKLLAGIIDSDGFKSKRNTLCITMTNKRLMEDIYELVRITGFWSNGIRKHVAKMKRKDGSVYEVDSYRLEINCNDFSELNKYIKIPRKRVFKSCSREYSNTKVSVCKVGRGEYYGFSLSDNPEFLLEDGTIVHNSSKTWSIFQFFLLKALAGENITITIVRDKLSWIKSTLLKDFQEMVEKYGIAVYPEININRADQVYNINGSEFAFYGLDYAEKLHGRKQDWSWINETMEVGKKHFDQLEMRTAVGMILDYNPYDDMHWVFDLQKRPDVGVIKSTMLDNPFLDKSIIDKIKSYEPTEENIKNGTADNYMWEVYGKGEKARLIGAVFTNWDVVKEIPSEAKFLGYGMDFGYTNDPTALVAMYMMDNEPYFEEIIYRTGMTNQDIVNECKVLGIDRLAEIYADSSEPKSIEEIRRCGYNIRGAIKGQDSVMYGIDLLKQYKFHITEKSRNLELELRRYKYMEDKLGNSINRPVDAFNHGIDALRYIATVKLSKKPELQFIKRGVLGI